MVLSVRAIRARREPVGVVNVVSLVEDQLGAAGFAGEMIRRMADYPAQRSTVSGYRRTGGLGRGWRIGRRIRTRNRLVVEVENPVNYAVHVQGPRRGARGRRQTAEMRSRGWPNITDTARTVFGLFRPAIVRILTQVDTRVRRRRLR